MNATPSVVASTLRAKAAKGRTSNLRSQVPQWCDLRLLVHRDRRELERAVHESAHAVIALLHDLPVAAVSLNESGGLDGSCDIAAVTPGLNRGFLIAAASGVRAEKHLSKAIAEFPSMPQPIRDAEHRKDPVSEDLRMSLRGRRDYSLMDTFGAHDPQTFDKACNDAGNLVAACFGIITCVAGRLIEARTLTGPQAGATMLAYCDVFAGIDWQTIERRNSIEPGFIPAAIERYRMSRLPKGLGGTAPPRRTLTASGPRYATEMDAVNAFYTARRDRPGLHPLDALKAS